MRSGSKLGLITIIATSLFVMNLPSAQAAANFATDLEITSKVVAAEIGSPAAGKTPFTMTIQTKVKNNNNFSAMTFDKIGTDVWLTGGTGGAFVAPVSSGTVSATVTPTSGTVTGTDTKNPASSTERLFEFTDAQVRSIPASSFVQVEFNVTVTFTTGSAGTLNLLAFIGSGASNWVGGAQANQDSNLSSLSSMAINVTTGGGVTANFGTAGQPGYICDDNNTSSTISCFINNTYYGKPYITFTATVRAAGYEFSGWGGDCTSAGTSSTCTLRVTNDPSITANFVPYPSISGISPSTQYFANNVTITGTKLDSSSGWEIFYEGVAGDLTDNLVYRSTSFVSQSATSLTVQLPTLIQIESSSETEYGTPRTASSGLSWEIYPYANLNGSRIYGGTAQNLVLNSATISGAPTIGSASTLSATSASVTFTAPGSNGGSIITGYTATSSPGGFTGTLAGATAGTINVTGLSASTAYTFTVTATNSEGTSSASAASNSITTSAASGGTGGGGTTTSTTAADELRRQQKAVAKQKQDQELREILSLVPTIAGLAQGIAGLGNSLLLPKKCVKGKLVKNVKAGAKCPKGYRAKK
jgi:uncharacterized repeat protein (TIGR02543 family)